MAKTMYSQNQMIVGKVTSCNFVPNGNSAKRDKSPADRPADLGNFIRPSTEVSVYATFDVGTKLVPTSRLRMALTLFGIGEVGKNCIFINYTRQGYAPCTYRHE